MTVTSEVSRSGPYNGNGSTTVFPYEFKIFTAADLLVTEVDLDGIETTLVNGVDYTVDGVLSDDGGDVTLTTALAGDGTDAGSHKLTIRRVLDATQTMNLRSQGKISAEVLERAHDRAIMLIQQLLDERDRSLRLIESEAGSDLLTLLPSLADRKGKQLTFDPATGQPTASSPTSAAVSAAMEDVVASATLALARTAMGPWGDALVTATSGTTARSHADRAADVFNVRDFGVIGGADYVSAGAFWRDAGFTQAAYDDTAGMMAIFNAVNAVPGFHQVVIDLCGLSIRITTAMHLTRDLVTIRNGTICQSTDAQDCLVIDGATPSTAISYINLENVSFHKAHNATGSGSLVRNKRLLGFFRWLGNSNINKNGRHGFVNDTGFIWMSEFDGVWTYGTYSSGFLLPADGSAITPGLVGGSTTTTLRRCFVQNVQTADPAYDIGNGFDTLRMEACSADYVSRYGRFQCYQATINNASSEQLRAPIVGSLPASHSIIEVLQGYSFALHGYSSSVASGFVAPAGPNSFLKSSYCPVTVSGIRGEVPGATYATYRLDGTTLNSSEAIGPLNTAGANVVTNGGRICYPNGDIVASGTYINATATQDLMTLPAVVKQYRVTFTYSYLGNLQGNVWYVTTDGTKYQITMVSDGPDYIGNVFLTVAGGKLKLQSTPANLSGPYVVQELGLWSV